MPNSRFAVLLPLLVGCAGHGDVGAAEAADAAAPSQMPDGSATPAPLFQALFPNPSQPDSLIYQCLEAPLPIGKQGSPNCVVVSARTLPAGNTAQELAACRSCDGPGLEPLASSAPLERIGEGLSNYPCVCAVTALPADADCPPTDWSRPSWCYADTKNSGAAVCGSSRTILGFSPPTGVEGALYVACFAP